MTQDGMGRIFSCQIILVSFFKISLQCLRIPLKHLKLQLEFGEFGKFVENVKKIPKYLVKYDHSLLWNNTYSLNQVTKELKNKYRLLKGKENHTICYQQQHAKKILLSLLRETKSTPAPVYF